MLSHSSPTTSTTSAPLTSTIASTVSFEVVTNVTASNQTEKPFEQDQWKTSDSSTMDAVTSTMKSLISINIDQGQKKWPTSMLPVSNASSSNEPTDVNIITSIISQTTTANLSTLTTENYIITSTAIPINRENLSSTTESIAQVITDKSKLTNPIENESNRNLTQQDKVVKTDENIVQQKKSVETTTLVTNKFQVDNQSLEVGNTTLDEAIIKENLNDQMNIVKNSEISNNSTQLPEVSATVRFDTVTPMTFDTKTEIPINVEIESQLSLITESNLSTKELKDDLNSANTWLTTVLANSNNNIDLTQLETTTSSFPITFSDKLNSSFDQTLEAELSTRKRPLKFNSSYSEKFETVSVDNMVDESIEQSSTTINTSASNVNDTSTENPIYFNTLSPIENLNSISIISTLANSFNESVANGDFIHDTTVFSSMSTDVSAPLDEKFTEIGTEASAGDEFTQPPH